MVEKDKQPSYRYIPGRCLGASFFYWGVGWKESITNPNASMVVGQWAVKLAGSRSRIRNRVYLKLELEAPALLKYAELYLG
jgi:hypothetical protein